MSPSLSRDSSLENFRKDAKRWLRALRAGDAGARRRLLATLSSAPAEPGLRDVQLALAREYGFRGWSALRQALDDLALAQRSHAERVETVLRSATWQSDRGAATRLLKRWPDISAANLYTAVSTGNLAEVERRLADDPGAAARKGGPLEREPLLYLAYARLPGGERHGVEIARLLIEHGGDPNAQWIGPWGEPAFTVVTGVIGEGEGVQPPHPEARELAALLIERGADPYDRQALYNTSIIGDDVLWLAFLWEQSKRCGRLDAWHGVDAAIQVGGVVPLNALDYLLSNAVSQNHLARAGWLIAHGADPDSVHAYSKRAQREEALVHGYQEMAELLVRHGAATPALTGSAAFRAACMRLDREAARALLQRHPEFLGDSEPMLTAARRGRPDIVALLLELGINVDVADETEQRALHNAVMSGSLETVRLLVSHGADIDRPTTQYGGAMGFAAHFDRREIAAFLAPVSRDVHNLTYLGMKARLSELFATDPTLVNARHARVGVTPLFVLPENDNVAMDVAAFLLAHGADPNIANGDGLTAENTLRREGREELADFLHNEARRWPLGQTDVGKISK
jgi:hypothetical protein